MYGRLRSTIWALHQNTNKNFEIIKNGLLTLAIHFFL
jgi:hypothetical protein